MSNKEVSYLTAEGAEKLKQELEDLKGPGRLEISTRLRSAIEMGDLSENADYIKAKEDQGFLEGRIMELTTILGNMLIIDEMKQNLNEVGIGDRITIQEEDYDPETYHLVGPQEANPSEGKISHKSPIGKALFGHKVGDIVTVEAPEDNFKIKILKIE